MDRQILDLAKLVGAGEPDAFEAVALPEANLGRVEAMRPSLRRARTQNVSSAYLDADATAVRAGQLDEGCFAASTRSISRAP